MNLKLTKKEKEAMEHRLSAPDAIAEVLDVEYATNKKATEEVCGLLMEGKYDIAKGYGVKIVERVLVECVEGSIGIGARHNQNTGVLKMRATLRRSGKMMFTVLARVAVGYDALFTIGMDIRNNKNEKLPKSRSTWEKVIRRYVTLYGTQIVWSGEEVDSALDFDYADEKRMLEENLARNFPEIKP